MKLKQIAKITLGLIIFFTLPTLLFFGFLYVKYDEDLPNSMVSVEADQLAQKMLAALNDTAFYKTDYIEWSFKGIHHYKWYKTDFKCDVLWDEIRVELDLKNYNNSRVFVADHEYNGIEKHDYIHKAERYFNNDSFWLVAPYKVFDKGTLRGIVTTEEGKKGLMVTYTKGGSTPGDSYLWHLDDNGMPVSFQMWVSIIPIGGLEASWDQWTITQSGAMLPTNHEILFLDLTLDNISTTKEQLSP